MGHSGQVACSHCRQAPGTRQLPRRAESNKPPKPGFGCLLSCAARRSISLASMSAPARAALFDLDGTLLDSIPAFLAITRRACRELGWPQPAPGYIREVMTLGRSPIEALLGPVPDPAEIGRASCRERV